MSASSTGWRALWKRFTIALVSCAWLVGGGIGYAIWLANDIVDERDVIEDLELEAAASGRPVNFLIIGSDTRSFVDTDVESDQFGDPADQTGQRSIRERATPWSFRSHATSGSRFPAKARQS
jgi:hypothetical protein